MSQQNESSINKKERKNESCEFSILMPTEKNTTNLTTNDRNTDIMKKLVKNSNVGYIDISSTTRTATTLTTSDSKNFNATL
jgi:hypothetical protein